MASSLLAVAAVLALLGFGLLWARRMSAKAAAGLSLRVVDAVQLGSGRSVSILQSGQRYFLLGATAHSISLIAELAAPDVAKRREAGATAAAWPRLPQMAARLRSLRNVR
jgi:flagellar biogenesis protein FliO